MNNDLPSEVSLALEKYTISQTINSDENAGAWCHFPTGLIHSKLQCVLFQFCVHIHACQTGVLGRLQAKHDSSHFHTPKQCGSAGLPEKFNNSLNTRRSCASPQIYFKSAHSKTSTFPHDATAQLRCFWRSKLAEVQCNEMHLLLHLLRRENIPWRYEGGNRRFECSFKGTMKTKCKLGPFYTCFVRITREPLLKHTSQK